VYRADAPTDDGDLASLCVDLAHKLTTDSLLHGFCLLEEFGRSIDDLLIAIDPASVNPIEQVWGSLKSKELANLCCDTIDAVADIAEEGLDRISRNAALCFAFLSHSGLRL
jgi:hypothetical protein